MRRLSIYFTLFISFFFLSVASPQKQSNALPPVEEIPWQLGFSTPWVDSVLATLNLDQRIAQLIMIGVHADQGRDYYQRLERQVREYNPAGIIFFKGGPIKQVQVTNRMQAIAQTPMLVAMDAEWGPAMRLDSVMAFPNHLTMGAIAGENLIYQMGREAGKQLKRLGVHMSFGPVADVNYNPQNPIINFRSFGENRHNVSQKAIAYMQGLQDEGIIAAAKHFPGHGDTHLDSHLTLPQLDHSRQELDSIHIFPFSQLINSGLHGVMVGHLEVPALEPEKKLAASLSKNVIEEVLQDKLQFKGLVMTDALDMRGVTDYFKPGDLELRALLAGNDLLLVPQDVPAAIRTIRRAVENGVLDPAIIDQRVRKVLYYKQITGLNKKAPVSIDNLLTDLNNRQAEIVNKRLTQAAITLVRNENELVPLRDISGKKIAVLSIGANAGNPFQSMLGNYARIEQFSLPKNHSQEQSTRMMNILKEFDLVVVGVHRNNNTVARNYGITQNNINLITHLAEKQDVILSLFANPYSLMAFGEDALNLKGIIIGYQDGRNYEEAAAQVIFGGLPALGRLPVSAPPYFPVYKGFNTLDNFRVQFAEPEDAGLRAELLATIDSIAQMGIDSFAYPGCQIAVIKDGKLIYHKAFGNTSYFSEEPVELSDIYDLASLTKIAATTASVMRLVDEGKINLHKNIGDYLPVLKGSDKEKINIRDLLAHQGRFRAWLSFQNSTFEKGVYKPGYYSNVYSAQYSVKVASDLYLLGTFRDSIYQQIIDSPLQKRRSYIYSDLGFMLLGEMIHLQTGLTLDQYAEKTFFEPMGLSSMTFNPLNKFPAEKIIPSENDTIFRKQVLRGYVNDPAAALMGGVAGHAGLFSNALDVAVLMQMFLQGGEYAGKQYIQPQTIREFTRVQFAGNQNRRGLGFDKPAITPAEGSPACKSASPLSFGHSGFTGTYAWVDPKENLVYVFVSNRTFPYPSNRKIIQLGIRLAIHQAIYDAIYQSRSEELSQIQ